MRRRVLSLAVLATTVLAVPAQAQEEPGTLARNYYIKVKAGHTADFEEAMKKQIQWYGQNDESWAWHAWQWETGDQAGQFMLRSPGHHWKDLDDRAERTARATAHFQEVVGPHLESLGASIGQILPDVSHWPDDYGDVSMVSVYDFRVHYGMDEDFRETIGQIHEAIGEAKWPVTYAWGVTVSGGEVPNYWLVIPHKSWADMQGPEKPFWEMMEETVGRKDAGAIRASLRDCIKEERRSLARFRPDLSYIPGGE